MSAIVIGNTTTGSNNVATTNATPTVILQVPIGGSSKYRLKYSLTYKNNTGATSGMLNASVLFSNGSSSGMIDVYKYLAIADYGINVAENVSGSFWQLLVIGLPATSIDWYLSYELTVI